MGRTTIMYITISTVTASVVIIIGLVAVIIDSSFGIEIQKESLSFIHIVVMSAGMFLFLRRDDGKPSEIKPLE